MAARAAFRPDFVPLVLLSMPVSCRLCRSCLVCQEICQDAPRYVKICPDVSRYVKRCQDMSRDVKKV